MEQAVIWSPGDGCDTSCLHRPAIVRSSIFCVKRPVKEKGKYPRLVKQTVNQVSFRCPSLLLTVQHKHTILALLLSALLHRKMHMSIDLGAVVWPCTSSRPGSKENVLRTGLCRTLACNLFTTKTPRHPSLALPAHTLPNAEAFMPAVKIQAW